jgi:ABC-type dipeptide/oligopeptide/nickel transport system ATPase component
MSLLQIDGLSVTFPTRGAELQAVKNLSLTLDAGETLGIVGESGSGKSVAVMSLLGLVPRPPARITGRAVFDGCDLLSASPRELRRIRGRRIAMIFQDPMTSLNPYQRIIDQVAEPLRVHEGLPRRAAHKRAIAALEEVGIPDAATRAFAHPHEFSGGMRQRVMIAMAMITRPEILIADEPTTALDVTVQRQILGLIQTLQRERGSAVVFISHDLALVGHFCDRIAVMRRGDVVETGEADKVLRNPEHAYTRGLLQCHPALHNPGERLRCLEDAT